MPPHPGPKPSSLLAALLPAEVRDFFPDSSWAEVRAVADEFHAVDPQAIDDAGFARVLHATNPEVLLACWKTPPLPASLPPRLRYVCYVAGSVRRLVTRDHLRHGLLLTNWGHSVSHVVAEGALGHILACLRRTPEWCLRMHQHRGWKDDSAATASLFGRKVGLHGFGRIARELVKLLRPFRVPITVFAPDVTPDVEREWDVRAAASLDALFADNDVVVELAPLIPATQNSVQARQLERLRPGSVFVNVGRAEVVDEAALIRLAQAGEVQIGLDVFWTEPLPAAHPLRGLPNVLLTPHLAGPTTDRRRDAGAWALRNLRAYAAGEPLAAVVSPEDYDLHS